MSTTVTLHISPTRVVRALGGLALLLIILSLAGTVWQYRAGRERWLVRLFNLDREWNVPTLLKFGLWLLNAGLLLLVARRGTGGGLYRRRWAGLGLVLLFLSLDEMLQLHEQLSVPVRALTGVGGFLYFAWVLPAMGLLLILAALYARPWLSLPPRFRLRFALAALIYLGGAVGVEMVGARLWWLYGAGSWPYLLTTQIEESLQLAGEVFLLATLLRFLEDHLRVRTVALAMESGTPVLLSIPGEWRDPGGRGGKAGTNVPSADAR